MRSCMPGRETIDWLAPSKRTSKYASSLSTSRSCSTRDLGDAVELLRRALGGRRVVQVVEDEQARARRDAPLDRVDVDGVAVAGVDVAVGHGDPADELDERGVDGEAGVGVEDLVAHVHGGHEELADDRLAARLHRRRCRRRRRRRARRRRRRPAPRAAARCRRWRSTWSCRRGWPCIIAATMGSAVGMLRSPRWNG